MQKNKECSKNIVHVRQDDHDVKTKIRSGRDSNSRRIAPLALKASAFDHSATAAKPLDKGLSNEGFVNKSLTAPHSRNCVCCQFRLATTIKGIARATP